VAVTENQIEVGKLQWFYRQTELEKEKDCPSVVFLHGVPTHSYTWRVIMANLAEKGFNSVAPDWIGCGASSKPGKRDFAYTPDAYTAALDDLIAALTLDKLYLVVQGFLGSVGIQYALRNPDKIAKLVILNAPITTDAKLPWKMQQWGIPFVGDMLTQDPLQVDKTLEGGSGFVIPEKDLDVHRKPFLTTSAVGRSLMMIIKNLQLSQATTEISQGLKETTIPTLILWGEADPWLDVTEVETLAQTNSAIAISKLSEAKHYPQEHWPKEISEEIRQFFRRQVL
jgi:pimeloyl-ACP methyl ester carboxylesterase